MTVNTLQAYKAMVLFLATYNEYLYADKINILLGSRDLSIFGNDERPTDQTLWTQWEKFVREVIQQFHGSEGQ